MIVVEKKRTIKALGWGVLLFICSPPAWPAVNQIEFNFGRDLPLSWIQASGSSDRVGSQGTQWSADFLHQAAPRLYIGVGGGQIRSNDNVSQTFVANAASTIRSKTTSILLLSRTDLESTAKYVPYLIAGIGWVHNAISIAAVPNTTWTDTGTSESRSLLDQSNDTFGYTYGLGMDVPVTDWFYFGVEARYQGSLSSTYILSPAGTAATGTTSLDTPIKIFTFGVKAGIKY